MKKVCYLLSIMFLMFFQVLSVNAASLKNNSYCEEKLDADKEAVQVCYFVFDVDGTVKYNQNSLKLTLENVTIKSIETSGNWTYKKQNDNLYTFETSSPTLTGHVEMATIVFRKVDSAQECSIKYECDWQQIDRSCSIYAGNYYGPDGNIISAIEYEKMCLKTTCKDYGDGSYSDKNGNLVSKEEYEKQCLPHYCEVIDNTYFGQDGTVVTKEEFQKQCEEEPKYYCSIIDNKYYGLNGTVVDYLTYLKECAKPVCYAYGDGTYSDKNGNLVSKEEYEKQCQPHYCEVIDDTYFGKGGTIVDKETYLKECEENKNYCQIVDGIYYDKEGNEVSQIEYEKQCLAHYCEILSDGTYYGKNGNIVTEEVYKSECEALIIPHYCEVINGTYYDVNGNVVSKEQYEISCHPEIENPQTGVAGISLFFVFLGLATGILGYAYTKKNNKIYHL